ncbi:D-aspartate oxidase [Megachile rotundata]|uniref:D-aspartate oxidase n=1 Tax=Megachile rotundata TaxID=143995 RepID=UPI000614C376|nr:PREDICTED: D-amino-acid oxidase isoform X2 [Megachile rotundata]
MFSHNDIATPSEKLTSSCLRLLTADLLNSLSEAIKIVVKMRVAIIGAGVIGMTSALAVKNSFPMFDVHVFANEFSPDTTGDGSAGLWSPYLLGTTSPDKVLRWGGVTHRWMEKLWKEGLSRETGVALVPVYHVISDSQGFPDLNWIKLTYGAHRLTVKELERLNEEHKSNYKDGWLFLTYTCEPVILLPWLKEQFEKVGGKLKKSNIHTFDELIDQGYDLIINCSGLGARELVGDNTVIPIRGQVARVTASWVMHGILVHDNDGNYIIPNFDSTVIGGTHQEDDYDCTPREEDFKFIRDGCCQIMPSLQKATVIKQWAGLRPGRPEVRLEPEIYKSSTGKEITVIHNYGHGGSGVTLSWGCAVDVVKILRNLTGLKSNL